MTTAGACRDLPTTSPQDAPVFEAPWQAQLFALTVSLSERGHFSWDQWTKALGREIAGASARAGSETYYRCWLRALEKLIGETRLLCAPELETRKQAWQRAAAATPHGEPIVLGRENSGDSRTDGSR